MKLNLLLLWLFGMSVELWDEDGISTHSSIHSFNSFSPSLEKNKLQFSLCLIHSKPQKPPPPSTRASSHRVPYKFPSWLNWRYVVHASVKGWSQNSNWHPKSFNTIESKTSCFNVFILSQSDLHIRQYLKCMHGNLNSIRQRILFADSFISNSLSLYREFSYRTMRVHV